MSERIFTESKRSLLFRGISINAGRVVAPVCLFSIDRLRSVDEYALNVEEGSVEREIERFRAAREACTVELGRIAVDVETTIGKAEAEIFTTQIHIMNDPKLVGAVDELVAVKRKNAEWAIASVLDAFEERFASLDNQYLRERSSDISEVRMRLLGRLANTKTGFVCEGQPHCRRGAYRVLAAEELTPAMIVNMRMEKVVGIITERGGITSHAAILARSLGIPAITGIENLMRNLACGDTVLINGDTGEVHLHPDDETVATLVTVVPVEKSSREIAVTPAGMEVLANASTIEEVKHARAENADGIGLFRTEIFFVGSERLLSEEEQYAYYANVAEVMPGKTVTFRMLDVGGDKPLPFLRLKKESNPFLGWRGARFLLGNPLIFNAQIRALGRLTLKRNIRVLFPMVVDPVQMKALLDRAREALAGVEHDGARLSFGAMFEVPSAFIQAREIMKLIDFSSIGSNDLIQYLFAIDRDNEMVSQEYDPTHPALWSFLADASRVAVELGKPLSICGEMAGREGMPRMLIEAGITSLSVAPRLIARVRSEMIRIASGLAGVNR